MLIHDKITWNPLLGLKPSLFVEHISEFKVLYIMKTTNLQYLPRLILTEQLMQSKCEAIDFWLSGCDKTKEFNHTLLSFINKVNPISPPTQPLQTLSFNFKSNICSCQDIIFLTLWEGFPPSSRSTKFTCTTNRLWLRKPLARKWSMCCTVWEAVPVCMSSLWGDIM